MTAYTKKETMTSQASRDLADEAAQCVADQADVTYALSDEVAGYAEPGLAEEHSATALCAALEREGFNVRRPVAALPTAFIASWEFGSGGPAIGLMCEYDATPGDSQQAVPREAPVAADAGGFADLHNGIGAASVAAAIAAKRVLERRGWAGRLVVFGTPAEKLCIGKPVMAAYGLFDDIAAFVAWHPRSYSTVEWDTGPGCYRASIFDFTGRSSYAGAPWAGVSALDAAMLMNIGVQFMREHIPRNYATTISEVITQGGQHPTSIPARAQVWYVARSPGTEGVEHAEALLRRCADAACLVTGASHRSTLVSATRPWLPNHAIARLCYDSLSLVGAPKFPPAAKEFGRQMLEELGAARDTDGEPFDETVTDPESGITRDFAGGADDVTEFTWHAPTARIYVAHGLKGGPWPSWTGAALATTDAAHETVRVAASAVALSALELVRQRDVLDQATAEFKSRSTARPMAPLLEPDWRLPEGATIPR
jgi:aminobenzoyl-glutamate utilization protein B